MIMNARQSSELVQAFVASEELDIAARYIEAGRRYSHLSDAVLKKTWAGAYVAYYDRRQADRWRDCMDADAELTLRRLPRPEHLIPPEAKKRIVARIRETGRRPEVMRGLRTHFQDFVRQCAARRN